MKNIISPLLELINRVVGIISPRKGERRNLGIEKQTSWSVFWGTSGEKDSCACSQKERTKENKK